MQLPGWRGETGNAEGDPVKARSRGAAGAGRVRRSEGAGPGPPGTSCWWAAERPGLRLPGCDALAPQGSGRRRDVLRELGQCCHLQEAPGCVCHGRPQLTGTDPRCPLDLTATAGRGGPWPCRPQGTLPSVSAKPRAQAALSGQTQLCFGSLVPIIACLLRWSRIYRFLTSSELQQWRPCGYRGLVPDLGRTFAECARR